MLTHYCHTGALLNDRTTLKALTGVSIDVLVVRYTSRTVPAWFFFLVEPASPRGKHGDV